VNGYNFTQDVRRSLAYAREEAVRLRHDYVGTEHILLGLVRDADAQEEGGTAALLQALSIAPGELREDVEKAVKPGRPAQTTGPDLPYTSRAKKVLELAMSEARELDHSYVGTEHLLLGLMREESGVAAQVLRQKRLTLDGARAAIQRVIGTTETSDTNSAELLSALRATRPAPKISILVAVHEADGRPRHRIGFDSAREAIAFLEAARIARGE